MKINPIVYAAVFSALACATNLTAQNNVGQWDFKNGDLTPTIGTQPLQYFDGAGGATQLGTHFGSTATLGISSINGSNANVMEFPASGASGGYVLPVPAENNGGGSLLDDYTIVMDLLIPSGTVGHVCPLVQTDDGVITPDADFVLDSNGGIGAPPGPFNGAITSNRWYRVAFSVSTDEIDEFINGQEVGVQGTGGVDSRFALSSGSYALLFQNSTTNGASSGYVSSIQLWDSNLSPGQIAALGLPSASKIPTNITAVPSYIVSRSPLVNQTNTVPLLVVSAILNSGDSIVDSNSIDLLQDGVSLEPTIAFDGTNYTVTATISNVLAPFSIHTNTLVYSDNVGGPTADSWTFSVFGYQNVTLPAPIYLETFDEVAEGAMPTGWVVTNWTDSIDPGLNVFDVNSDFYLNWALLSTNDYVVAYPFTDDYTSPGFPEVKGNRRLMIPPIVENGVLLTSLADTNIVVAESDQRNGNQVNVMFTSDYNFAGMSNIYVSFHNMNEQNQDNICSVEYSIDQGTNWLPLLYMLDDGTTDADGSDVVTNQFTGQIDVFATFDTARNDQAHGLAYGAFIGAPITTNLIPYIRPCRNDDPVQQKRIELFRLSQADNQSAVRLRFMQAGTGSWFFDIDRLGFYSIPQPVVVQTPQPVLADYNGPATFFINASGGNLSYQWLFDGTNLAGATTSTYFITNTASNNIGVYNVIITNNSGAVTSAPVPLSLVYTPVILSPPEEETITVGESASFAVQARGGRPLFYQWLFNSNAIPGATLTNYNIANATTNDSGYYQVQISNNFSTIISSPVFLDVFAGPISNSLVVHLTFDNTFNDSSSESNNASPVGNPTFAPGLFGQAVHVTSSGTPANAPATNNYVTLNYPPDLLFGSDFDNDASDFSISLWVQIFSQNDDKPFISNKDWNSGGNPGWGLFSEGGGMKWNYEDSAENFPGVGSSRRDSPAVAPQLEDGGWHHVLVTFARRSFGKIYVDGSLVNTTALGTDSPTNVLGSADTIGLGFLVNIGQDGTGHYTDNTGEAAIDMLVDDLAIWRRVLTDEEALGIFNAGLASNTVDLASTTSPGEAPIITLQPQPTSAGTGATAQFNSSAIGTPPFGYTWYFGASPLPTTNATLLVTNVQSSSQGNYSVVVTNSYGSTTSQVATLTFTGILPPAIALQPVSAYAAPGSSVTFTASGAGTGTLTNQWLFNNVPIPGANGTNLTISSVAATNAGTYTLEVSSSGGSTNSADAVLAIFSGTLGEGVVAYLPFDGDYNDYSGLGNNGTPVGSPSFAPGRVGQAAHITTTSDGTTFNYVTLGYPSALQFGTNNFSVALWVNYTNQADDSPFISQKNWESSGNVGWGIFSQDSGNFRVQSTGTSGTKENTTATPLVRDGNWHQIVATFWRGQFVSVYTDGALTVNAPLTFGGSIDTVTNGYSVNIGQDGTGGYNDTGSAHIDGLIDEVILWNRVVLASEVASLYSAGTNGLTPLSFVTNIVTGVNSATLSWRGGVPPFNVQTTSNLSSTNWTTAASTSTNSATIPIGGGNATFIRIQGASQ